MQQIAVSVKPSFQPLQQVAMLVQQVAVLVQPRLQPPERGSVDVALMPEASRVLMDQADRIAYRIELMRVRGFVS